MSAGRMRRHDVGAQPSGGADAEDIGRPEDYGYTEECDHIVRILRQARWGGHTPTAKCFRVVLQKRQVMKLHRRAR